MKRLLDNLYRKAKKAPQRIIYPESTEPRILKAVYQAAKKGICNPILLGTEQAILKAVKKHNLSVSFFQKHTTIINPQQEQPLQVFFAKTLYKLRKKKGLSKQQAQQLVKDPMYFATLLVYFGEADGIISGATHTTSHTFKPALQLLRKNKSHHMSSFFLMEHTDGFYLFADCAVTIQPTPQQLAHIAVSTAESAKSLFKLPANIAMLSFSTHGSNTHPLALTMKKATQLTRQLVKRKKMKQVVVDGELQADAAVIPAIHKIKVGTTHNLPGPHLQGKANILIFPNLEAANIAYKLVEWLGHYAAIGPITQGLGAAVNDLSRGCTIQDIVDVTAITVVQAQQYAKGNKGGKKS